MIEIDEEGAEAAAANAVMSSQARSRRCNPHGGGQAIRLRAPRQGDGPDPRGGIRGAAAEGEDEAGRRGISVSPIVHDSVPASRSAHATKKESTCIFIVTFSRRSVRVASYSQARCARSCAESMYRTNSDNFLPVGAVSLGVKLAQVRDRVPLIVSGEAATPLRAVPLSTQSIAVSSRLCKLLEGGVGASSQTLRTIVGGEFCGLAATCPAGTDRSLRGSYRASPTVLGVERAPPAHAHGSCGLLKATDRA
jgi:hypothetical protein